MTVVPRPPLTARLSEGQRVALDCGVAAAYGLVMWWLLQPDAGPLANAAALSCVTLSLVLARRLPLIALALAIGALCLSPVSADFGFAALAPACYALFQTAAQQRPRIGLPALACGVVG